MSNVSLLLRSSSGSSNESILRPFVRKPFPFSTRLQSLLPRMICSEEIRIPPLLPEKESPAARTTTVAAMAILRGPMRFASPPNRPANRERKWTPRFIDRSATPFARFENDALGTESAGSLSSGADSLSCVVSESCSGTHSVPAFSSPSVHAPTVGAVKVLLHVGHSTSPPAKDESATRTCPQWGQAISMDSVSSLMAILPDCELLQGGLLDLETVLQGRVENRGADLV